MAHNKRDAKKAITTNIPDLNNAISSSDTTLQKVVTGCEGNKLIPTDFKNTLLDPQTGRTALERANQLTSYIQTTVDFKPAHIDTFLCVLVETEDIACIGVAENIAATYGLYRLPKYSTAVSDDKGYLDSEQLQVPVVVKELNIAGTPASTSSSASASTTTTTSTQSSATASHISAATNLIDPHEYPKEVSDSFPVYEYKTKLKGERGIAFIINNVTFAHGTNRPSSVQDENKLRTTFAKLHYEIITRCDLTSVAMKDELSKIASQEVKEDHDSFVCCILSHGNERGIEGIGGHDDVISVPELTEIINCKNCPKLFEKPKIFFIQACRGDNTPEPVVLDNSTICTGDTQVADGRRRALPPEADFLVSFSTSQDNVACRGLNTGSQYIIKLCETIDKYSSKLNLYELLLVVHRKIAGLEFKVNDKIYHQMPELRSTLQGKFKF